MVKFNVDYIDWCEETRHVGEHFAVVRFSQQSWQQVEFYS
jgi:hypothetical protein